MIAPRPASRRSLGAALVLASLALASTASAQVRHEYNYANVQGQLATRPNFPANRADSVRRPGFNGRLWISRPIIGGAYEEYPQGSGDPGPSAYGADEYSNAEVYARVGQAVVGLNPWETVQGRGNRSLEMSRNKWLRDNGYTGGVRTFVNDLYMHHAEHRVMTAQADSTEPDSYAKSGAVKPRATITLPLDQPRFKSRMHVEAGQTPGAAAIIADAKSDAVLHVSWPTATPAEVGARTNLIVVAGASQVIKPAAEVAVVQGRVQTLAAKTVAKNEVPSSQPAQVVLNADGK